MEKEDHSSPGYVAIYRYCANFVTLINKMKINFHIVMVEIFFRPCIKL